MDKKTKVPPKPLLVARQDFIESLAKLISNAELPAFVIHDILKDATSEMESVVTKQYVAEKEQYVQAVIAQAKETKNEPKSN